MDIPSIINAGAEALENDIGDIMSSASLLRRLNADFDNLTTGNTLSCIPRFSPSGNG
jgi:hypothetical protein